MTVTDERWLGKMALQRLVGQMAGIQRQLTQGACAGEDPDQFFPSGNMTPPEQARRVRAAKLICGRCELRQQCLAGALERREGYGVWGGLTADERKRLLKARPAA